MPFFKGFGVLGRAVYDNPIYLDAANPQQVSAWARFDVGAWYTFDRTGDGKAVTVRADMTSIFDGTTGLRRRRIFSGISREP